MDPVQVEISLTVDVSYWKTLLKCRVPVVVVVVVVVVAGVVVVAVVVDTKSRTLSGESLFCFNFEIT